MEQTTIGFTGSLDYPEYKKVVNTMNLGASFFQNKVNFIL